MSKQSKIWMRCPKVMCLVTRKKKFSILYLSPNQGMNKSLTGFLCNVRHSYDSNYRSTRGTVNGIRFSWFFIELFAGCIFAGGDIPWIFIILIFALVVLNIFFPDNIG